MAGVQLSNQEPVVEHGLKYWAEVPASVDGVLGGFGNGPLPRVDAMGSRSFLIRLMPHLSTVPSSLRSLNPPEYKRRIRALDVGAGVGRVTSTVLLPLVSDVVLLEPTPSFINEAIRTSKTWRGIADASKSVTFLRGTLQDFDPCSSIPPPSDQATEKIVNLGRIGFTASPHPESPPPTGSSSDPASTVTTEADSSGYDVIWCQWCLGHMSDPDLVAFFRACKTSLRPPIDDADVRTQSLIIVKENTCFDEEDGGPATVYDSQDSSITRSDQAWKAVFKQAGLELVKEEVQLGLPEGLFTVKSYALR